MKGHAADVHPRRRGDVERGPPFRHQSERAHAGQFGDGIRPRPGCVDQQRCAEFARRRSDQPAPAVAFDGVGLGVHDDARTSCFRRPEEALVQAMDVHFPRIRFNESPGDIVPPQNRHTRNRGVGIDFHDGRNEGPRTIELPPQQLELIRAGDGDHAARRKQRMSAKTGGRIFEKSAACDGESAHRIGAVVLGKTRRRPSG